MELGTPDLADTRPRVATAGMHIRGPTPLTAPEKKMPTYSLRNRLRLMRTSRTDAAATSDRFETTVNPNASSAARRRKDPLSRRARWSIVLAVAVAHPALLLGLHPVVGEASNLLALIAPVVATLLLGIHVGVFFIFVNTFVTGVVFTLFFRMSGAVGLPKGAVSLLVTTFVCWGADRLHHFIEQRRAMEDALHQAQKIEAIGRLAAGVAHDINNTLNAIMGSTFALRHELTSYGRSFQDLENIALACDRGAQLTRNLLGFARKSCSRTESFSLNSVAREVQVLISRTAKKTIRVETELAEPPALMSGDEAQIEHALMNLCLNALDAMEDVGTLTIGTSASDDTVSIRVSDTGSGMEEHVREHAFEPFFTTKPVGKGTGIGLSMVYGAVQAMGGTIGLSTQPGVGTTISLHFPRVAEPLPDTSVSAVPPPKLRTLSGLTILVIEDEPLVLRGSVRMLRALGSDVLSATNGREGIETFRAHRDSVSLAIVDLVMPGIDGIETILQILEFAPETPILLTSGYTPETAKVDALLSAHPKLAYVAKPCDSDTLLTEIGKLLPARLSSAPTASRADAG